MAFFSEITPDKYTQIMLYMKDDTPLYKALLDTPDQINNCYLMISALRVKRGQSIIQNPFNEYICIAEELNNSLSVLNYYDENDFDNIENICLTIWYLVKFKQYSKGIEIFTLVPNFDINNMRKIAEERIKSKLAIFRNNNFDLNQLETTFNEFVHIVG